MTQPEPVGILGGTGPLGRGLGRRLAAAGTPVVLGSRDAIRAATAATTAAAALGDEAAEIRGGTNAEAAGCPTVLVAVPYDGHAALLEELSEVLAGRLVIDCVNPLGFDKQGPHPLRPEAGSAAQEAAALLPDSRVIAAFHHLSAELLNDPEVDSLDCDVLVLGEDRDDVAAGVALADLLPGVTGVYGGRLRNAGQVEALTANLIAINRRHRVHSGIRVTGLPR
ncbi:MAG TPA: NADPH-dependent F420 reductase [Candidatus Avipropionibacterium avicola]|uniref:NADPH-dependent F420 reductase n=1 Tax=Candidatus Avipropionibacterium avicola TaxID=2840701 RepID=A0A9D1KNJ4_9ACTN|nr:NADPH-dependent F420 reductase [Candidatus Avipropionibacterium avicola]